MITLSIDSSAKSAGAALTEGKKLISECYVNAGLTHSKTLLTMIDNLLKQSDYDFDSVEQIAVNCGPGSFTGIRIGAALAKGLAFSKNLPCCGVSALESLAYNFIDENCLVYACVDARCERVYTAFFRCENGIVIRLTPDSASNVEGIREALSSYNEKVYFAGDGAEIYYDKLKESGILCLPGERKRLQNAYSVALAALNSGEFCDASLLSPVYLRPPQAERERLEKQKKI